MMPNVLIRHATLGDLDVVLAMNEASTPHLSSISLNELHWFTTHASYFRVATVENEPVGFLIALTPEAEYGSENFRWFRERYQSFVYVDRIAVSEEARRNGVGTALYRDVSCFTDGLARCLTCEVNTRPPNEVSLAFHERQGFRKVGSQDTENGTKSVSLMLKELDED